MIQELLDCCKERVSLGENDFHFLVDHLESLSETDLSSACYHTECQKPIVNKTIIARPRAKKADVDAPGCSHRGPGRPSTEFCPKRTKTISKSVTCMFASCKFCSNEGSEPLHRVFSDNMGQTFLEIKLGTRDDHVRTCVSDLEDAGDAAALEKYYHRNCLQYAKHACSQVKCNDVKVVRSLCDEELLLIVQNTLVGDDASMTMAELNDEYLSLLKRYSVEAGGVGNYRKHLK